MFRCFFFSSRFLIKCDGCLGMCAVVVTHAFAATQSTLSRYVSVRQQRYSPGYRRQCGDEHTQLGDICVCDRVLKGFVSIFVFDHKIGMQTAAVLRRVRAKIKWEHKIDYPFNSLLSLDMKSVMGIRHYGGLLGGKKREISEESASIQLTMNYSVSVIPIPIALDFCAIFP